MVGKGLMSLIFHVFPVEPEKVGKGLILIFLDFSVAERDGDLDAVILGYPRGLCDPN